MCLSSPIISSVGCASVSPLSPRVFSIVAEAAIAPLWKQGVQILLDLDDWLIYRCMFT